MFEIQIKVTTESNCLVTSQTETFSVGGLDQSTAVDRNGKPMIPATSFKGAFRNIVRDREEKMCHTQCLVKSIFHKINQKFQNMELPNRSNLGDLIARLKTYEGSPKAEYIFGVEGVNHMPRLYVSDFTFLKTLDDSGRCFVKETKNSLEEKNDTITSRPRTYQVCVPNVLFQGTLVFQSAGMELDPNLVSQAKKELLAALEEFNKGWHGIGNSKSRGYGRIRVEAKEVEQK